MPCKIDVLGLTFCALLSVKYLLGMKEERCVNFSFFALIIISGTHFRILRLAVGCSLLKCTLGVIVNFSTENFIVHKPVPSDWWLDWESFTPIFKPQKCSSCETRNIVYVKNEWDSAHPTSQLYRIVEDRGNRKESIGLQRQKDVLKYRQKKNPHGTMSG